MSRRSCSSTNISAVTFRHTYRPKKQPHKFPQLDQRKPHQVSRTSKAPASNRGETLDASRAMYIVNSGAAPRSHAGRPRSSSYWARARSRPCSDPHIAPRVRRARDWRLPVARNGSKSERYTVRTRSAKFWPPSSSKRRGTGSGRGGRAVPRGGRSGGGSEACRERGGGGGRRPAAGGLGESS